jgi:hypothetical protein
LQHGAWRREPVSSFRVECCHIMSAGKTSRVNSRYQTSL